MLICSIFEQLESLIRKLLLVANLYFKQIHNSDIRVE